MSQNNGTEIIDGTLYYKCNEIIKNGFKCIYKSKELSKSRDLILDEYNIREVIYKKIQEIKDIIYR